MLLIALLCAAAAAPLPTAPALGPVGAALEAAGWAVGTPGAAALALGDVVDPRTGILHVRGADCFPLTDLVRRPLAASALDQGGGATARVGLLRAGVDLSLQVQLAAAEEQALPVVALRPLPACAAALRDLGDAGAPIGALRVVQGVLIADLVVERCGAARAGGVAPAGDGAVEARRCSSTEGKRAVIAHRWAPLELDHPPAPNPPAKARKRGPPCWLSAPCPPHPAPRFAQAVGRGNSVGEADAAARAAVLAPHTLRLGAARGGASPETLAALAAVEERLHAAVQIAARAQDDGQAASLAVLDRPALAATLRAEAEAQAATLAAADADAGASPLGRLAALRAAAPAASALFAAQVLLAGLDGAAPPPGPPPTQLAARRAEARAALRVRVAEGPAAPRLRMIVEEHGLLAIDDPAAGADLRIELVANPGAVAAHPAGLRTHTLHVTMRLTADDRPLPAVTWTEQWAGATPAAAAQAAQAAGAERAEVELRKLLGDLL